MNKITIKSDSQTSSLIPSKNTDPRLLKVVQAINEGNIPGTAGQARAALRVGGDSLALTRNILYAIPTIDNNHPIVDHLGYYAGIVSAFFAFRALDGGVADYKRSAGIGDAEGRCRSGVSAFSGGIDAMGALASVTGRVCDTVAAQSAMVAVFGAASALFGIASVVSIGASFWGALCCSRFYGHLKPSNDAKELQKALRFLKEAISVTPQERAELQAQIEKSHPLWRGEKKAEELEKKLLALTEVKVRYVKRRTGNKSIYLIATQTDQLLAQLERGEGIQEATAMLGAIRKENRIKTALYILGLIASLIGLAALCISTFLTIGILPFVLYAIAGAMYLSMTIYGAAGTFIKKDFELPPIEEALIQCN